MTREDLYAILGVAPSSEDVVIRAAFRALLRRYHPDANTSPDAVEKTARIREAYEVLSDPKARAAYDRGRHSRIDDQKLIEQEGPPIGPMDTVYDGVLEPEPKAQGGARRRARSLGAIIAYLFIVLVSLGVGVLAFQNAARSKSPTGTTSGNSMSVDENLTTTDMNATSQAESSSYDPSLNGVDANASAATPPLAPTDLSTQPQSPVNYGTIEHAADRFSKVYMARGMAGARQVSEHCHQVARQKPGWDTVDSCAAFDYAAAYIDESVSRANNWPPNGYFQFQRDNQADDYSASGAPAYSVTNRLTQIKRSAEAEASDAVQTALEKERAANTITPAASDTNPMNAN